MNDVVFSLSWAVMIATREPVRGHSQPRLSLSAPEPRAQSPCMLPGNFRASGRTPPFSDPTVPHAIAKAGASLLRDRAPTVCSIETVFEQSTAPLPELEPAPRSPCTFQWDFSASARMPRFSDPTGRHAIATGRASPLPDRVPTASHRPMLYEECAAWETPRILRSP